MFTNPEALQTPYFGDFMEASSRRHDQSLTLFASLLPSLRMGAEGGAAENSKLLIMTWSFRWPALIKEPTWVASLPQKTLLSPRKSQGFQEVCVRNRGQRPILEQEILLVFLSLRKLRGFQELSASIRGQRPIDIFYYLAAKHRCWAFAPSKPKSSPR